MRSPNLRDWVPSVLKLLSQLAGFKLLSEHCAHCVGSEGECVHHASESKSQTYLLWLLNYRRETGTERGKQGQKEGKKNPRKKWGHMKLRKDLWYDWWPVKVRGTWDKGTKYWSMTTRGKIMQVAYCKFPSLTNRKTNRNRPGFCHSYRGLSGNNKISLCHSMLWEKKNNSGLEVFAL